MDGGARGVESLVGLSITGDGGSGDGDDDDDNDKEDEIEEEKINVPGLGIRLENWRHK